MGMVEEFGGQTLTLKGRLDGREVSMDLKVGRITLSVLAAFSAWCRDVTMERCRQLAAVLPESGRPHAIRYACDLVVKDCDWGGEVASALMRTPVGVAKLIHLSLSKEQAQAVTVEQLMELLDSTQDAELASKIMAASGVTPRQAENASANPP